MAHHGHLFGRKTFHRPTYCHHCTDMLWGLIQQGYICEGTVVDYRHFSCPTGKVLVCTVKDHVKEWTHFGVLVLVHEIKWV